MEAVKPLVKPALAGLANASRDGARRCSTPLSGTLLLIPLAWWLPGWHGKTPWFSVLVCGPL
jgi:hypothetical protein